MKTIKQVLQEKKGEKAHRQAVEMGLKYKGFGYWVNPNTGAVEYKTENDELVPVDTDVESEKAGKDAPEAEGAAPSGGVGNTGGLGGQSFTAFNKQLPTGMGTNVQGIADNGLAQAPNTDNGRWEPGPDGDNYTTQDKILDNNVPEDSFVGKSNYYQWKAGKDGDNYTTLSFDQMVARAQGINEEEQPSLHKQDIFRKVIGFDDVNSQDPSYIQRANQAYNDQSETGKGSALNMLLQRGPGTGGMEVAADRLPAQLARRKRTKDQLTGLNDSIKELVQDPNYDLGAKGEELGSGMFGSVYESKDGKNVIKEGQISAKEIAILNRLKDVKAFPNLINAQIDEPFSTNDDYDEDDSMGFGGGFIDQTPTANGKIAMSKMSGQPYGNVKQDLTEEQTQNYVQKLWFARAAMHKLGISHNDMHSENIFIDDAGNPSILDLGLANDDPLSALMEGIGGVTGQDYQLDQDARMKGGPLASLMGEQFNFVPDALRSRVEGNINNVRERLSQFLMDRDVIDDMDPDSEEFDEVMQNQAIDSEDIMKGGLRLKAQDLANLRERMPFFNDENNVLELINMLYDNVSSTETGQRMSNAFDKLKDDRIAVAKANVLRRKRGAPDIEDRIADRKVLDPDD